MADDRYDDWWTGDRRLYCLAHAGYGSSNSNMGVEVEWRDIKKYLSDSYQGGELRFGEVMAQVVKRAYQYYDLVVK